MLRKYSTVGCANMSVGAVTGKSCARGSKASGDGVDRDEWVGDEVEYSTGEQYFQSSSHMLTFFS